MRIDVPTEIIPLWFVEKWTKENAEPNSALDALIKAMIHDWEVEEARQNAKYTIQLKVN